jgi:hypothetical protein
MPNRKAESEEIKMPKKYTKTEKSSDASYISKSLEVYVIENSTLRKKLAEATIKEKERE